MRRVPDLIFKWRMTSKPLLVAKAVFIVLKSRVVQINPVRVSANRQAAG